MATTLRHKILLFLEMSLSLEVMPSYVQLKKYLHSKNAGSLNVALHWLRQRNYIARKGGDRSYVYYVTVAGIHYLHKIENKNDIAKLTVLLQKLGKVS